MYPVYLAVGLINILAKSNNYGIKVNDTGMDIRVRRDLNHVPILDYIHNYYTADNIREKRASPYNQIDKLESGHNGNYSTRHNHTSHKRRRHNHGMYIPHTRTRHHKTVVNDSNNKSQEYQPDLTRYKPIQETGHLHKRESLPAPQAYTKPEGTTSKPLYKKIWSFFSRTTTTTPGYNNGVSAQLKKKKKRKIIPACVLCDTGCPVGYVRQESYCVSGDPDYE